MITRVLIIAFAIVLVVLIAGIVISRAEPSTAPVVTQPDDTQRVGENMEGEADPARMTLDMTEWRWVDARNPAGKYSITFKSDGTFSIKTDCNNGAGTYTSSNTKSSGTISFEPIVSTEKGCLGSQEGIYKQMIESATTYQFTGRGQLVLGLKDGGKMTFN